MAQQASSIIFSLIKILLVLFNKANGKFGSGFYSSQRSLDSESHGTYPSEGTHPESTEKVLTLENAVKTHEY